jgi:hypothetical protein
MKQILIFLSLCLTTASYAGEPFLNECNTDASRGALAENCTVTLSTADFVRGSSTIFEAYNASCSIKKEEYYIVIMTAPYGVGDGYEVGYTKKGNSGISFMKAYETKGEAISAFVHIMYGSDCRYSFN